MTPLSNTEAVRLGLALPKRSKFGAKKAALDGFKFDSIAEMNRYAALKQKARAGLIADLRLQTQYELHAVLLTA